ncbi:cache domain-containing sensor histidine kinase [Niallia sp. FSL M8-0099]|uniref:cache domain-containing sensor histidine kinase n=1 Tax=Niallia sp. FSL M8-0099 TaxID=2954519 RepID=UPI0030F9DC28
MHSKFIPIKKRLMLMFLSVVIPIFIVGIYLTINIRQDMIESRERDILVETERVRKGLEDNFTSIIQISDWIYQDEGLEELVTKRYANPKEMIEGYNEFTLFDYFLRYHSNLANIRFFVDNKSFMTNSNFVFADEQIKETEWYEMALQGKGKIYWYNLVDPVTEKPFLALVRSVYNLENQFLGVLAIYVDELLLMDILNSATIDNALLLDKKLTNFQYTNHTPKKYLTKQLQNKMKNHPINVGDTYSIEMKDTKPFIFYGQMLDLPKSITNHFQVVTVMNNQEILNEVNKIMIKSYTIIGLVMLLVLFVIKRYTSSMDRRILQLKDSMHKVANGDFDIPITIDGNDEIRDIYNQLYTTMESLRELLHKNYQHQLQEKNWQLQQKESEFKLLASQINPHFLYNTLEMIRMRALKNKDKEVSESVKILSKLLRRSLENNQLKYVKLSEEIDFLLLYLRIQQLRFGNRIRYEITSDVNTAQYHILPLILQPIVENAFVHGIEEKVESGLILINIVQMEEAIHIFIQDDGKGIPKEKLIEIQQILHKEKIGNRIGLNNVNERIKRMYGKKYGLTITSTEGKGTIVKVTIPIKA